MHRFVIAAASSFCLAPGANVMPLSIEQFAAFVRVESEKHQRIIRETGVKAE